MTPRAPITPLAAARAVLAANGVAGWLVGGAVRDALLDRPSVDVDIAVPSGAVDLGRAIARGSGGAFVPLSPERGIVRVVWSIAGAGDDGAGKGGRDDAGATSLILDLTEFVGGTLHADLAARDFTINALAVPLDVLADAAATSAAGAPERLPSAFNALRDHVVDVTGGLIDLDARRVRMTGAAAFDADPIRLLRGPRIAAELGFTLDGATAQAITARAPSLARPARERVRDELLRLLAVDDAAAWIGRVETLGLLAVALPHLAACRGVGGVPGAFGDVLDHSLAALDAAVRLTRRAAGDDGARTAPPFDALVDAHRAELATHWAGRMGGRPRALWFRLGALLHDIGKPACARWNADDSRWRFPRHDVVGGDLAVDAVNDLRLGSDEASVVIGIVRHHLRLLAYPDGVPLTRRDIYRYFQDVGDTGVDVAMLTAAEVAAKHDAGGRGDPAGAAVTIDTLLGAWFDAPEVAVAPRPLLSGDDVMAAFGLPPGPRLGALLAGLREAQASGDVDGVDSARAWIAAKLSAGRAAK